MYTLSNGGAPLAAVAARPAPRDLPERHAHRRLRVVRDRRPGQPTPLAGRGRRRGRPLRQRRAPDTTVLDESAAPVEPGSGVIGRIAHAGHIPLGYYNDPEKTAETFVEVDGVRYVLPGDMATVEADGSIVLLGRGSVCINTGGEKVLPRGGRGGAQGAPAVYDVLVVGVPDERWGERVVAVVQPADGADARPSRSCDDHCRAHARRLQGPARAGAGRRGRALTERQGRLPLGEGGRYRLSRRTPLLRSRRRVQVGNLRARSPPACAAASG